MTGSLSAAQCAAYQRDGYVSPVAALAASEAQACLERLTAFEARTGYNAGRAIRGKGHLKLTFLYRLIFEDRVLEAVEAIIGPDILCWGSSLFVKESNDPGFIAWHQDSYTWGLEPDDVVSAWIALAPSTLENGAMQVIPGSHRSPCYRHHTVPRPDANLILTGLAEEVDLAAAVPLVLAQGEMSLHHVNLLHGSDPNRAASRRCGFAIRYVAPHVRQRGDQTTATLVRGVDRFGHFTPDPVPQRDMDPAILAFIDMPGTVPAARHP